MTTRLQLKYGLVSEGDRLSNSSDALLVSEPTTGSKTRTKGSLYLIVASRAAGGRTRDACRLVADTIRREYYYDESAGIAIVLEKAIRSANRRLRNSREGGGVALGSLGIAVAVIRANELYVATSGDAEAYLVRAARLLMPEHEPGDGLPAAEGLRVAVWRGDFSVGDSLVLCSRNLVGVVGTEELKNAVVTLHPQSAVEHLHHLFVAAGGQGSDAVLAIEASEVSLARVEHRLVPVTPSEPLAGVEAHSPIPLADQFAGAAAAVTDRAGAARGAVRDAFSGGLNALLGLMPQRRTTYRRIVPAANRRETQRRAAMALLAFLGVVAILGVVLWYWGGPGRGTENPAPLITEGEQAYSAARQKADQVLGSANMLVNDPPGAQRLLKEAWADLDRAAEAGVDPAAVSQLQTRLATGLDQLYSTYRAIASPVYSVPEGSEISGLVQGPDDSAYAIVGGTVVRVDPQTGASATIIRAGDGGGNGIGAPALLARGGPDLLIVDVRGELWRWRHSDAVGGGTLGSIRVSGEQAWGPDMVDLRTFLVNPDLGLYRLYVPHPGSNQILRYEPAADGSGFSPPTPYFVGEGENVASFRQLFIDGDVYALTPEALLRYFNGRRSTFDLAPPPDADDLRPSHRFGRMDATGTRGAGLIFVWDALHTRILVHDKADGAYVEQYLAADGSPAFEDVRGMYIIDRGEVEPPVLVWAAPGGVFQSVLAAPVEEEPSPEPTVLVTPGAPTVSPTGASPEPIERPRRTPRTTPAQ